MFVCDGRRCLRIVTTASVELTSPSVDCGGATTLMTPTANVTHSVTNGDRLAEIAVSTLRHHIMRLVLPGTFDIDSQSVAQALPYLRNGAS